LIDFAHTNGHFGYQPLIVGLEGVIPHFLWRNKPTAAFNNGYAHQLGMLAEDDDSTSVSFGPSADAYNMGGWLCVFLGIPIVLIGLFTMADSTTGSLKNSPWGLAYTVFFLHAAPESTLGGCITSAFVVTGVLVVTVYVARYAMPLVGSIFFPERRKSVLMRNVREFPKAAVPPSPQSPANDPA
jgi:hypothetical protein